MNIDIWTCCDFHAVSSTWPNKSMPKSLQNIPIITATNKIIRFELPVEKVFLSVLADCCYLSYKKISILKIVKHN